MLPASRCLLSFASPEYANIKMTTHTWCSLHHAAAHDTAALLIFVCCFFLVISCPFNCWSFCAVGCVACGAAVLATAACGAAGACHKVNFKLKIQTPLSASLLRCSTWAMILSLALFNSTLSSLIKNEGSLTLMISAFVHALTLALASGSWHASPNTDLLSSLFLQTKWGPNCPFTFVCMWPKHKPVCLYSCL